MIKALVKTISVFAFIGGCSPIPITPDARSPEEKAAALALSIAQLSGEYDVVESRNDIYFHHNFSAAKSLNVTTSGQDIIFKLSGRNNSKLVIMGSECAGNNNKLSTNVFCNEATSGMNFISFGKEKYEHQIKSGTFISGYSPLDIRAGDFLLEFFESGSGRQHYYKLKKKP